MPKILKIAVGVLFATSILNMLIKATAYYVTGSLAFYADALESLLNIASSCLGFYGLRLSFRPPDVNHRYGHHKVEYLVALLTALLILSTAGFILIQAYSNFILFLQGQPVIPQHLALGTLLNLGAGVVSAVLAFLLFKLARQHGSPLLRAEGHHLLGDLVVSCSIIVALWGSWWGQWYGGDALIAGAVGLFLLAQGIFVATKAIEGLMDSAVSAVQCSEIRQIIEENAGQALEYHDLKTRVAGRVTFVEFHLVVPGALLVSEAHEICDNIEFALAELGYQTIIHIEPETHLKYKKD